MIYLQITGKDLQPLIQRQFSTITLYFYDEDSCQEAGLWMKLMLTIGTHKQPYVPIVKRSVSGVNHNN